MGLSLLLSWPSPNASRACRPARLLPFWWTASLARRVYLKSLPPPPLFPFFLFFLLSFLLPHLSSSSSLIFLPPSPPIFHLYSLSFSLFVSLVCFLNCFRGRFWLFARIVLCERHRRCWCPRDLKTVRFLPSSPCVIQQP